MEHRGTIYAGEHAAIVEKAVWDEVNAKLRAGRRKRPYATRAKQNALLAGLLICKSCQRAMIATYTSKGGRRYRYYVCHAARQNGWQACPTKSVPARVIEDSVVVELRAALNQGKVCEQLRISATERLDLLTGDAALIVF